MKENDLGYSNRYYFWINWVGGANRDRVHIDCIVLADRVVQETYGLVGEKRMTNEPIPPLP